MKPSIYPIPTNTNGRLYIMPKPSSEWLQDDIHFFKTMGITNIVCLLTQDEIIELNLEAEKCYCLREKILFTHTPITDRDVLPIETLQNLSLMLSKRLETGHNVSIHCRAGIGRAGMIACCMLQELGMNGEEAIQEVSNARGIEVPDTEQQRQLILEYENL